jgi:hypothetical protein
VAVKLVSASPAFAQLLALGLPDDRPLADQAAPAIETVETSLAAERIAGVDDCGLELGAASDVTAAMTLGWMDLRIFKRPRK